MGCGSGASAMTRAQAYALAVSFAKHHEVQAWVIEAILAAAHIGPQANPPDALSAREREVFVSLVRGERAGDIAKKIGISIKTVSTYRARIFDKLGVTTLGQLIQLNLRNVYVREMQARRERHDDV